MVKDGAALSLVDDDESVRESVPCLLRHVGYQVKAFASAEEFLASEAVAATCCLILDVGLPGMSGADLQQVLLNQRSALPIVFITAQGDPSLEPRLIAKGAAAVLFKPFTDTALLDAIASALRSR